MNKEDFAWILVLTAIAFILFGMASGCADTCVLPRPEGSPGVGRAELYIIDGEKSEDYRATVKVYMENGYCTGAMLDEHTVITAAHCLPARKVCIPGNQGCRQLIYQEAHPKYDGKGVIDNKGDVAILQTATPLPGPFATLSVELEEPLECYPGLLAQGYGQGGGGQLTEREVFEVRTGRHFIYVTEGPCYGDSGSVLYAETPEGLVVIGVASFVRNKDCSEGRRGWAGAYTKLTGKYGKWAADFVSPYPNNFEEIVVQ